LFLFYPKNALFAAKKYNDDVLLISPYQTVMLSAAKHLLSATRGCFAALSMTGKVAPCACYQIL